MVSLIRGGRRPTIGVQGSRGDVGLGTATVGRRDRPLLRIVAKSSRCRSAPAQHSVDLHAAPGQLGAADRPAVTEQTDSYREPKFEETWVVYQRVAASVSLSTANGTGCCLQICWTSTARLASRLVLPGARRPRNRRPSCSVTSAGASSSSSSSRIGDWLVGLASRSHRRLATISAAVCSSAQPVAVVASASSGSCNRTISPSAVRQRSVSSPSTGCSRQRRSARREESGPQARPSGAQRSRAQHQFRPPHPGDRYQLAIGL